MFDVLVQMANGEEEEEEEEEEERFGELLLRRRLLLCRIAVTTLNNNRLTHPPATRASGVVRVRDTHVLCVCTEPGQTRASLCLSLSLSLSRSEPWPCMVCTITFVGISSCRGSSLRTSQPNVRHWTASAATREGDERPRYERFMDTVS